MRVSLFITCFNDSLFPQTGKAAVRVLERLGHEVEFRPEQTCCGQMHSNSGYPDEALSLVRKFVGIYRDAPTIVVPSTSCTSTIRSQYPRLAAGDHTLLKALGEILPRVFEFSEFLTRELALTDVGAYFPHRVTYHASCNSLRGLRLARRPDEPASWREGHRPGRSARAPRNAAVLAARSRSRTRRFRPPC